MKTMKGRGIITLGDTRKVGGIHYEIMARCYNPNRIMYPKYGGRGIGVCEEWHDKETFKTWMLEQGFDGTQRLERIDSTKDYSPDNCRLGTKYKKKEKPQKEPKQETKRDKKIVEKTVRKYGLKVADNPLYPIYYGMHQRCENAKDDHYKAYGGNGITVCDEWSGEDGLYNFTVWAMNNGWQKGLTIDRIDNNRGYAPENCRWATPEEQSQNMKGEYKILYNGEIKRLADIATETGIDKRTLYKGIVTCGIPPETVISVALTTMEYLRKKPVRLKKSEEESAYIK